MSKKPDLARIVKPGSHVSLRSIDPDDHASYSGKEDPAVAADLAQALERLEDLQQRLYAEGRRALLVVLQATDTAGKDGVLKKVVGPLDSRGVHVWSFKVPAGEETQHDYLWRVHARTPRLGEMAFFNRSHYEDVLAARVLGLVPEATWRPRFEHINAFEKLLTESGTRVVKFFLHISKDEQKERLEERLADPKKRWKFDPRDLPMRARWDDLQRAYEEAIERCSTPWAPWRVVPANHKWFRDLAVARALVDVLEEMDPKYPETDLDPARIVIP